MTGYSGTGYGLGGFGGGYGGRNCICDLPTLVILILIVLQFSRKGEDCDHDDKGDPVGNGILFIIALFYLSCVGCGRGRGAY